MSETALSPESPAVRRKVRIREIFDRASAERDHWIARNAAFYGDDWRFMRFLIPEGLRVLDLGCGTGQLLAALRPAEGVGVDLSEGMIDAARRAHPELRFICGDFEDDGVLNSVGGPFDVIVLSDAIGYADDCQALLSQLHRLCVPGTRIVLAYFNQLWRPSLRFAEWIGNKMPEPPQSWLSLADVRQLLELSGFEFIRAERRQLLPKRLWGLGWLVNNFVAPLPLMRLAALRYYVVARPWPARPAERPSCSVVVPCRNEKGNIEPLVQALPPIGASMEIIFVEGHSLDGTYEECLRVKDAYPDRQIVVEQQDGVGKVDAVRKGFGLARGDILLILDADRTVAPEDMPKFYEVLASGRAEFVNGTRLVYPMESNAMQFLNYIANRAFAVVFSWLLGQRFTDTLCGTKGLSRRDYRQLARNRAYFGEFDPFGDFELILGVAKLNLKIVEVPVRYTARRYGETQISRFYHGWQLLRMVAFAYRKLKVF
jgi:SAM-dependent methyltransferase